MFKQNTLKVTYKSKNFDKIRKLMLLFKSEGERNSKVPDAIYNKIIGAFKNQLPIMEKKQKNKSTKYSFSFLLYEDNLFTKKECQNIHEMIKWMETNDSGEISLNIVNKIDYKEIVKYLIEIARSEKIGITIKTIINYDDNKSLELKCKINKNDLVAGEYKYID